MKDFAEKPKILIKNLDRITKNISYTLQFIDSPKFMASFLSNLADN